MKILTKKYPKILNGLTTEEAWYIIAKGTGERMVATQNEYIYLLAYAIRNPQ